VEMPLQIRYYYYYYYYYYYVWRIRENLFNHGPRRELSTSFWRVLPTSQPKVLRVISAGALKNGGFFFAAGPRQTGQSSFSRKRAGDLSFFSVVVN